MNINPSSGARKSLMRFCIPRILHALALLCGCGLTQAAEFDKLDQQIHIEVKTIANDAKQASKHSPVSLTVQGRAAANQQLQLSQNDMVFYEQLLPEGEFTIRSIQPLNHQQAVKAKLTTSGQETEKAELDLRVNQKVMFHVPRSKIPMPLVSPDPTGKEDEFEFDGDFLRGKTFRNLSAADIKKLGQARPGMFDADVYRNGEFITKSKLELIEISKDGPVKACIPARVFTLLGVKKIHITARGLASLRADQFIQSNSKQASSEKECLHIGDWVAASSAEFDNGALRLDIHIPQAFIDKSARQSVPKEMLTRGENAAFVNYTFNNFKNDTVKSNFLNLNAGMNLAGWQLRQSSTVSQNGQGPSQVVLGETVVKRPLIDMNASLAIGDILAASPVIGGVPLRGVRVSSVEALYPDEDRSFKPTVRGVARTNARVRISQNNTVFFEQNIPPGPFEFTDLNPVSSVGNLQVVVSEADGIEQRFVVPYSMSAGKLNPGSYRYSIATGLYRNFNHAQNTPVLQASLRYGLNSFITPTVDFLAGPNYRNLGLQSNFNSAVGSLNFNALMSHFSSQQPRSGHALGFSYLSTQWKAFTLNAGSNFQSNFYTTPSAGLGDPGIASQMVFDNFKRSNFANLGFHMNQHGSVSLGVIEQTNWSGSAATRQIRAGYSTTVKNMGLSISANRTSYFNQRPSADAISLSLSIPLSSTTTTGSIRASADQTSSNAPSTSLSYSGSPKRNDALSYGLSTMQSNSTSSTGAYAAYQHPWGHAGISMTSGSNGAQQTGISLSGGLVGHSGGLILAPALGDTFAIVEVPGGKGAGVLGSSAQVNESGYGVMPYLSPYYLNDVQISLETASMDLDIDNATQKVAPVDGSIVRLKFKSTHGRPVAFTFNLPNSDRIPIGASVLDKDGHEIGNLGQGNRSLLRLNQDEGDLKVVWGDKPEEQCDAKYKLDQTSKTNNISHAFTSVKLACHKTTPS